MRSIIVLFMLVAINLFAFSPYEERVATSKINRVGLIARVRDGKSVALEKSLKALSDKKQKHILKKHHITNISFYKKTLPDKKTWYMVYFDYRGKDYLQAARDFEVATPQLSSLVTPHPRAKTYGRQWLQMEWICFIRGANAPKTETRQKVAMVTRIKPEKEQQYRILHQTVWPGVTDQMARTHIRNFSIFLVEMDKEIYEFFYFEYLGKDLDADGKLSAKDPATLRWWKLTDVCQDPLPDAKGGIWSAMESIK